MANRSYLYSINEIPTGKANKNTKIIGLSEYNYRIPAVYKVLVSSNPQKTHSIIFDSKIGITGNYKKGLVNLKRYLNSLKREDIPNKDKLDEYISKALKFLNKESNIQEFFQLEIGEIMNGSFNGQDVYSETLNTAKELEVMFERVRGDILPAYEMNTYNWEEELGLDYWSNILYFDFSKRPNDNI